MKRRQQYCQQNKPAAARDLVITINLTKLFNSLLATTGGKQIVHRRPSRPRIHIKQSYSKTVKNKHQHPIGPHAVSHPRHPHHPPNFHPHLQHRGPTHSLITALIAFIPIFTIYHKKAAPYLIALASHSLIGDYITGQTQLLWPLTAQSYGTGIEIISRTNVTIELLIFLASTAMMLKTRDTTTLLQPHKSNLNLTLLIPTLTVLLPTFINFPSYVPTLLIIPHLPYIFIFSAATILDLSKTLKKRALENSNRL
jgi:hypothetical protein